VARREHREDLDVLLPEWTATHDAVALAWELQAVGVAAGPIMDAADCYRDPHLADRRFFERIEHPETGTYDWPGMPFRMSDAALAIRLPPADMGADNEYVYRELLGYSAEEYAELEREGQIGMDYDPDIP
jgi:benzylsuccinate CoA-transferase BbsF subunit